MLIAASIAAANERRRTVDVHGQEYLLRELVGAAPRRGTYLEGNETNDDGLPQGFLVSQPPGSVTPPHFHETHQFQVFVGGSGRIGKRRADPVTVQFAGGHTPYGPIAAGDRGIRYFTLRQSWDPGAKYMPAMRSRLVRGRQRQRLAPRVERPAAALGGLDSCTVEPLMAPEADGLGAELVRLGPGMRCVRPCGGGGQYQVVIAGALVHDGEALPRLSCRFASADERECGFEAGPDGAAVLALQFPAPRPALLREGGPSELPSLGGPGLRPGR